MSNEVQYRANSRERLGQQVKGYASLSSTMRMVTTVRPNYNATDLEYNKRNGLRPTSRGITSTSALCISVHIQYLKR